MVPEGFAIILDSGVDLDITNAFARIKTNTHLPLESLAVVSYSDILTA
jgi:hypothetical protein